MYNLNVFLVAFILLISSAMVNATKSDNEMPAHENRRQHGWFYGLFAFSESSPYVGVHNEGFAAPVIGYLGKRFSWTGPRLKYNFFLKGNLSTAATLQYQSEGFDPNDSDALAGLKKRKGFLSSGLSASYKFERFKFQAHVHRDIASASEGTESQFSVGYFYNIGPIFITPKLALNHLDRRYTNYYYGINETEANDAISTYSVSSALNKNAALTVATPIFFQGMTRLSYSQTWLDKEIINSPIVDTNTTWGINLSFTRFF